MPRGKFVGWRLKNPPKPPSAAVAPKAVDQSSALERSTTARERAQWLEQVKNAESPQSAPEENRQKTGLLDNIGVDQKADPQGWSAVVLERIRRLNN
jgi:hypothetical protein